MPLGTMIRVVSLLVAFLPLITGGSAIGGTAPFSVINPECGAATEARFVVTRAHIAAPPAAPPILPLAAVHGLVVMRED